MHTCTHSQRCCDPLGSATDFQSPGQKELLNLTTRAALVTRRSESPRESQVETPGFAAWLLPIGVWLVVLAENMGVIEASEFSCFPPPSCTSEAGFHPDFRRRLGGSRVKMIRCRSFSEEKRPVVLMLSRDTSVFVA